MSGMILVVEDEPRLAALLADYLRQAGYDPHCLDNGIDVAPAVREKVPELVLLDLMLPGKDGIEVCKEIRSFSPVPIVMVTARVEEIDRLLGLELGADDYICKPFSPREVVARVKAVLRRAGGPHASESRALALDRERGKAILHGRDLELTTVEFQLLHFLALHPGRIFSRGQLMDHIYPDRRVVSDRTIDSHVKKLRRKMESAAPEETWIRSVYGAGYKFEAP
jgi:two-component system, OmpR family, response regulator BaeR